MALFRSTDFALKISATSLSRYRVWKQCRTLANRPNIGGISIATTLHLYRDHPFRMSTTSMLRCFMKRSRLALMTSLSEINLLSHSSMRTALLRAGRLSRLFSAYCGACPWRFCCSGSKVLSARSHHVTGVCCCLASRLWRCDRLSGVFSQCV